MSVASVCRLVDGASADVAQSEGCVFCLVFRFLYKQLLLFSDADPKAKEISIFESSSDGHRLQLKPDIRLHLYANRSPAGAAEYAVSPCICSTE